MKNPFENYSKDTGAKICAIFIIVFLIALVLAEPHLWWVALIAIAFFAWLFWVMRNNP